jgi:two-component system alkaline phosphatase synthesis response regulator PhoP
MPIIWMLEDDENIRDLVRYALASAGFEARGFERAGAFWRALADAAPDLLLLDIMLPDEDGLTVLARLRRDPRARTLPVILLTAKGSEYDRVRGLDGGADDYIAKPFAVLELISRVKAVLRRGAAQAEREAGGGALSLGGIHLDAQRHTVSVEGRPVTLTHKEFVLLHYLLSNPDIVRTREQIMNHVWGSDYLGESRTVDMHIKTLRQKLGAAGASLVTVRGLGYKIVDG